MKNYKVKKEDLKGDIKGFPIEVVQAMADEQVRQGNKADVVVFQDCRSRGGNEGFQWSKTKKGYDFWHKVIACENFDLFFEKYPKKDYTIVTDSTETIKNAIQILKNEGYKILKPITEWKEI